MLRRCLIAGAKLFGESDDLQAGVGAAFHPTSLVVQFVRGARCSPPALAGPSSSNGGRSGAHSSAWCAVGSMPVCRLMGGCGTAMLCWPRSSIATVAVQRYLLQVLVGPSGARLDIGVRSTIGPENGGSTCRSLSSLVMAQPAHTVQCSQGSTATHRWSSARCRHHLWHRAVGAVICIKGKQARTTEDRCSA